LTKKVSILVEGGLERGLGHIFRSVTLAKLLSVSGVEVSFFTKSTGIAKDLLYETKLEVKGAIHDSQFIQDSDVIIVDRLDIRVSLARTLRKKTSKLVLFSCLSNANQYADLVVNSLRPPLVSNSTKEVIGGTTYLRGPRYLILREEFKNQGESRLYSPKTILVLLGGTDPSGLTLPIVSNLVEIPEISKVLVIVGYYPVADVIDFFKILSQTRHNGKLEVFQGVGSPYLLMTKSDLVITSPGLSMFEALSVNRPVLLFHQNALQRKDILEIATTHTRSQIKLLPKLIASTDHWTTPNSPQIKDLHIGEGRLEVIKEILR